MPTSQHKRTVGKALAYSPSLATDRSGTVFTTRGAAAPVTFTLPNPNLAYLGCEYLFDNVVDQSMTVAGNAAGDLLSVGVAATFASLAASTANQKRGARIRARGVESASGTFKWLVTGESVGVTYTTA